MLGFSGRSPVALWLIVCAATVSCGTAFAQCACEGSNAQTFLAQLSSADRPALTATAKAGSPDRIWEAPWADAAHMAPAPTRPPKDWSDTWPTRQPRTYEGPNLEYVMMPIGGIGTGTIWLDGQGRLAIWQIFNNSDERKVPDGFFAVCAQTQSGAKITRTLQTVPQPGLPPMKSLTYEGGYPIAGLQFADPDFPLRMTLEALNPMIPTDAANSALPCAMFRITARNEGTETVKTCVLATLPGALASPAEAGVSSAGGPLLETLREDGLAAVFMHQNSGPLGPGEIIPRDQTGRAIPGGQVLWVDRLTPPDGSREDQRAFETQMDRLAQVMRTGGKLVLSGLTPEVFEALARIDERRRNEGIEVFEDFEADSYEGWTIDGDGFGAAPSHGTESGQQRVGGFLGAGLVNTFRTGDAPQGVMTSSAFTIEKPFIGFLIGGGSYAGQTCLNLKVDGAAVRTATGKNDERLEQTWWDVREFAGKQAVLEIVDRHSGGWGHINVDHIFFSTVQPDEMLREDSAYVMLADALKWPADRIGAARQPDGVTVARDGWPDWSVFSYARVPRDALGSGFEILATTAGGDPVALKGKLGAADAVLVLTSDLPPEMTAHLVEAASGGPIGDAQRLTPGATAYGSMCLSSPDDTASPFGWSTSDRLMAAVASMQAPATETMDQRNGAILTSLSVPPGEERSATFVISWHFPNITRLGNHRGNLYSTFFADAAAVAEYVCRNCTGLWERTELYHRTLYQSNLPDSWLDAMSSQSVIARGPTAWWAEDGYFGGFEGCYGCCPLNCTHVWNYAQTHARLFPTVGRNMRQSDLLVYLHPDGETSHRQHSSSGAFIDGHCATIMGAYREYQLSADLSFLEQVWPSLKKATDWLVERIDADHDGVPSGAQPNTYDCNVSGANTFIGSQYLAALAAAEKMAVVMNDQGAADGWREIRLAGMKNQDERLWNGEYYIQIPGERPMHDYNTGCHSDQLLGQWWAHQVDLGYLFPQDRVKTALGSVMQHNFRDDFRGFQQKPRRYVPDDEPGLLMCTWPKGGRPDPFIIYADEVWTGIEYATAGAMIYEGMIDDAIRIVDAARSRYDGRQRDGLNSGPGGNPFNELECGKFYARAMSSWSLLIAAQGLVLEGPTGIIGFKPNWQPADHRSFFTAPEGWGLFIQKREGNRQTERIELRNGRLNLRRLVFEVPGDEADVTAELRIGDRAIPSSISREGQQVTIDLAAPQTVSEGTAVDVSLSW